MINRLNLPALTLPSPIHNALEISYDSSVINYTAWTLADDTTTLIASHVLAEILDNSHLRYQESDATKNDRIFTTESRWRILYIIDPAGTILHAHDASDNVTSSIPVEAGEWYLIDSHIKNSVSEVAGTQTAITINHPNDFSETEQAWINNLISE
jgi:hypothetical protein